MNEVTTNFALEAEKLISSGLYEDAINICEKGLLRYPNYSTAMVILAKAYLFNKNIDAAYQVIIDAYNLFPLDMAIVKIKNKIENDIKNETIEPIKEIEFIDEIIDNNESISEEGISENTINNTNNEDDKYVGELEELEKIANLMRKVGNNDDIDLKSENVKNENIELESENENIELSQIDIPQPESKLDIELQKINIMDKNLVEKLYEIDLELPRTLISTQLDWYSSAHIYTDNIFIQSNLFNDNFSLQNLDEIFTSKNIIDSKTQIILDIAEGLKGIKIQKVEEKDIEEEEFDFPIVASETMAKLLVKQQKISQAIKIYNLLILEKPDKKEHFQKQIDILSNN